MPMNVLSDDEWPLADHIPPTYYKQLEALGLTRRIQVQSYVKTPIRTRFQTIIRAG